MIVFSTPAWEWDITDKGLTLNEENEFFSSKQSKNYSFPIQVTVNEDVSERLGLVNIEGIYNYEPRIYGKLQVDNVFYDAYISIDDIIDERIELTFFYGSEILDVFDLNLRDLNYQVENTSQLPLESHANLQLIRVWPEATHQFVKVLREELKTKTNYQYFEGFLNNTVYDEGSQTWSFPVNTIDTIDGAPTAVNRNLMCPMPYLLEIIKKIFAREGLEIRGDFVNDAFIKKVLLVPKTYMEQFASSQLLNYSFSTYTSQETVGTQTINVYRQVHTPTSVGSYSLEININMNNVVAQLFELKVEQNGVILFQAQSLNSQVNINEVLDINIIDDNVFFDIEVELRLLQQSESISAYNNFKYEFKEGKLNIFPTLYTIKDYVPNLKVRDFFNQVRTFFNLKVDYEDNAVYLNYLDDYLDQVLFKDMTHVQDKKMKRTLNQSNLFKMSLPNEEVVLVDRSGQTYNESDFVDSETEKLEFDILPLQVRENYDTITAVYPEDDENVMFAVWDGKKDGENIAVDMVGDRSLKLRSIYEYHWSKWLKFRTNSEKYKSSFLMHFTEALNIKSGVFQYNRQHLIVSVKKKRISNEYYRVDMVTESL